LTQFEKQQFTGDGKKKNFLASPFDSRKQNLDVIIEKESQMSNVKEAIARNQAETAVDPITQQDISVELMPNTQSNYKTQASRSQIL